MDIHYHRPCRNNRKEVAENVTLAPEFCYHLCHCGNQYTTAIIIQTNVTATSYFSDSQCVGRRVC
ncbi:hypothetical protein GBAR_LOCUS25751, partial [Geodia barretti]